MLDAEDARLLADTGFMAASRGFAREAEVIFAGLVAARPEQEAGYLGHAFVRLLVGDAEAADRCLRALPPSDAVMAFRALAKARLGEVDAARGMLRTVAETALDPAHGAFAAGIAAALDETPGR